MATSGTGLPSAGSIYTYPAEAIHPALGFLVGWGYALIEALLGPEPGMNGECCVVS